MFAFLRLMIPALVVLTLVYIAVSIYSRRIRRGKLEDEWDAGGMPGERDDWIQQGLDDYDGSLRRKLIWGVYVVPFTLITAIIYLTNFH